LNRADINCWLDKTFTMAAKAISSDVLILGGGPAGLAAATAFSRQLITTTIFDSGNYRNSATDHMHNLPGFDHVHPSDFRAASRRELTQRYKTNTFVERKVITLRKTDDGVFQATDVEGQMHTGRKVVLATGVRDLFPKEIEGYAECWGKSIFHCLFCHGYEERGSRRAGLLAYGMLTSPAYATAISGMVLRLADEAVIYTNGDSAVAANLAKALADTPVKAKIDPRKIVRTQLLDIESEERIAIHFEDGAKDVLGFLTHIPDFEVNVPQEWREDLGLKMDEMKNLMVERMGQTTCPGLYAVGDVASIMKAVPNSIFSGICAAASIVHEIVLGH
jgi:thioredoxin reductase